MSKPRFKIYEVILDRCVDITESTTWTWAGNQRGRAIKKFDELLMPFLLQASLSYAPKEQVVVDKDKCFFICYNLGWDTATYTLLDTVTGKVVLRSSSHVQA